MTPRLLHRCLRWVAAHKPAGMVVHRSRWCADGPPLLQWVRDQVGQHVYPVHRIDRATSGLVLFALDPAIARHWSEQHGRGAVEKTYRAIIRGWIAPEGRLDYPLRQDPESAPVAAVTAWRRLATAELQIAVGPHPTTRYCLVEASPETGRTHQIRRHFAHLRHPIVGDVRHGDGRHHRAFRQLGAPGMMLCATQMTFADADGTTLRFSAPPAAPFVAALDRLGLTAQSEITCSSAAEPRSSS